jgi:hypothetical protein
MTGIGSGWLKRMTTRGAGCLGRSESDGGATEGRSGTFASVGTLIEAVSIKRRSRAIAPIWLLTLSGSNTRSRTNFPFL